MTPSPPRPTPSRDGVEGLKTTPSPVPGVYTGTGTESGRGVGRGATPSRRHLRLLPAPQPPVQMLVCATGCGTPLHPAAVAGTDLTTHPGCDPDPDTPDRHRRYGTHLAASNPRRNR